MKKQFVTALVLAWESAAQHLQPILFLTFPLVIAYAAVAKLAAAGIVDGYPDGTYKGDRTMTRYEMAQIVAKALAKELSVLMISLLVNLPMSSIILELELQNSKRMRIMFV